MPMWCQVSTIESLLIAFHASSIPWATSTLFGFWPSRWSKNSPEKPLKSCSIFSFIRVVWEICVILLGTILSLLKERCTLIVVAWQEKPSSLTLISRLSCLVSNSWLLVMLFKKGFYCPKTSGFLLADYCEACTWQNLNAVDECLHQKLASNGKFD